MKFLRSINYSTLAIYKVLISQSTNVFANLAFEQLLHLNLPKSVRCVLLYRNDPSIVIGKFQNPWSEINKPRRAKELGIPFARRCSGGGTVFHDLGNVNISFLAPRSQLNKTENLILITRFLKDAYNRDVSINERSDLVYEMKKVSGSACRIEKERSIHHFTLLLNSDLTLIRQFLGSERKDYTIQSTATKSVPSPVNNLLKTDQEVNYESFSQKLADYLCRYLDSGVTTNHFALLDPFDFSEVQLFSKSLQSWDWLYGLTPKFKFLFEVENFEKGASIELEIAKSVIKGIENGTALSEDIGKQLIGAPFLRDTVCKLLYEAASNCEKSRELQFLNCLRAEVKRLPIF